MEQWIISGAVGVGVAIGLSIHRRRQRAANASLGQQISSHLAEGERTLPALQEAMGMNGFLARGKIVIALGEMIREGKVEELPAPEGTPQLEKVRHIRYRLSGSS